MNSDINSRFEDWLLSPKETLDFEVKRWLNFDDPETKGLIAKALIALENHGGGFLLFGYMEDATKRLVPDPNRPDSLELYLTDNLNAVIRKSAEPTFHVEVTLQRHPETSLEFPLVRVSGKSKVPVRSDSATPGNTLRQHVYYTRAPGPESRGPLSANEWDSMLRRAISNQREEIISLIRSVLPSVSELDVSSSPSEKDKLAEFIKSSTDRWSSLNETLASTHPGYISLGYYCFGAKIIGKSKDISSKAILDANAAARKYTGWPAFVTIYQDLTSPKLVDGSIEAWTAQVSYPDVGHSDFWRIDPAGFFLLLRGYQEDSSDSQKGFGDPGKLFEATLPIWRLGEFLLRVVELGKLMFEEGFEVVVGCEWHGLENRVLFVHNMRRFIPGTYKSSQNNVKTSGQFSAAAITELLPDVVKALTIPLYEYFDFFVPPDSMYKEELSEMMKNRF